MHLSVDTWNAWFPENQIDSHSEPHLLSIPLTAEQKTSWVSEEQRKLKSTQSVRRRLTEEIILGEEATSHDEAEIDAALLAQIRFHEARIELIQMLPNVDPSPDERQ